jgi:hypothetical protein
VLRQKRERHLPAVCLSIPSRPAIAVLVSPAAASSTIRALSGYGLRRAVPAQQPIEFATLGLAQIERYRFASRHPDLRLSRH